MYGRGLISTTKNDPHERNFYSTVGNLKVVITFFSVPSGRVIVGHNFVLWTSRQLSRASKLDVFKCCVVFFFPEDKLCYVIQAY